VSGSLNGDAVLGVTTVAGNQLLPGLVALVDDLGSVSFVLGLAGEGKLVLGLSIRDFVDSEPLVAGPDQAGEMSLDILNVIELGCKRVVDIDDNDLPVGLALIEKSHDSEDLDLLDLTAVADGLTDLADIKGSLSPLALVSGWVAVGSSQV